MGERLATGLMLLTVFLVGAFVGAAIGGRIIANNVFSDCEALGGWRLDSSVISCSVRKP